MVHSERKLTLVFEYCDQDLKKYFDSCNGEIDQTVVKSLMYQLLSERVLDDAMFDSYYLQKDWHSVMHTMCYIAI